MNDTHNWPLWVNGNFVGQNAPAIAANDPGFLLGVAVFDTLLCDQGRAIFVNEHMARLKHGARALGIDLPADFDPRSGLGQVVERLGSRKAAVRLTVTPGAPGQGVCLVISTRAFVAPDEQGVQVMIAAEPKLAGRGIENIKTTGRARNVLARSAAQERGAYEALLQTEQGDISEGTVSNLFIWLKDTLVTPALERGCLPGIMRQKVIEIAREQGLACQEGRVEPGDLAEAQEVFLTNSLVRVLPVLEIQGCRAGLPLAGGPQTRLIRDRLLQLEAEEFRKDDSSPKSS